MSYPTFLVSYEVDELHRTIRIPISEELWPHFQKLIVDGAAEQGMRVDFSKLPDLLKTKPRSTEVADAKTGE